MSFRYSGGAGPSSFYLTLDDNDNDKDGYNQAFATGKHWFELYMTKFIAPPATWLDITDRGNWHLSSAKIPDDRMLPFSMGIHALLYPSPERYWLSDGTLPHSILIEYSKIQRIGCIALCTCFDQDETFCPKKLRVSWGTSEGHLDQSITYKINGFGWHFLRFDGEKDYDSTKPFKKIISTFALKFEVIENYHRGVDTKIRYLRVIAPTAERFTAPGYGLFRGVGR